MDMLMTLVVGWTLVGAFVFTVAMTCLSLVGWIRFAEKKQQNRLFQVLIVQLVVGAGARVAGIAAFDPLPVKREVKQQGANEATVSIAGALLSADQAPSKKQLDAVVSHIQVRPGTEQARQAEALRQRIRALPDGPVPAKDIQEIKSLPVLIRQPPRDLRLTPPK